jgi:hypothetical protein
MKSKRPIIMSAVLLVLGLGSLGSGWHGSATGTLAWPLSSCSVKFCGSASGVLAVAGALATILGLAAFVMAVISAIAEGSGH